MTNSSTVEQDYTASDGAMTFTAFSSIRYNITITNSTIGLNSRKDLMPKDSLYVIYCTLSGQSAPNNTLRATANTSLPWYLINNSPAYQLGMIYQDTSGCTSNVKFNVTARNNGTTIYYRDLGNPGMDIVLANYTVVKPTLGDELIWKFNATHIC
jgi:hypothetical protein